MITYTAQIGGYNELRDAFTDLSDKAQRAVLRNSLRAAGQVIVRRARPKARRRSGRLQDDVNMALSVQSDSNAEVTIGFKPRSHHGIAQELGTSTMSAQPFLRPALDEGAQEAIDAIAAVMGPQLQKVRAKEMKMLTVGK